MPLLSPLPPSFRRAGNAAAAALGLLLAAAACGCGGSAPGTAAKSYPAGPAGLDEALADLEAAEAQITARLGGWATASAQPGAGGQQGYAQPPRGDGPPGGDGPPAESGREGAPPATAPMVPPPPEPAAEAPAQEPLAAAPPSRSAADVSLDDEAELEERAEREAEDRCALACRALGSMRRAADHVCRAAGEADPRCGRARERVAGASGRVRETCDDCDG